MLGYLLALVPLYIVLYQPINQFLLSVGILSPNSTFIINTSSNSFFNFGSGSSRSFPAGVAFEPDFGSSESFLLVPRVDAATERSCAGRKESRGGYGVHILSRTPLVLYLEGFLTEEERRELITLSEPLWHNSTINSDGRPQIDTTIRNSLTATPPRTNIVQCIEARALALQGWKKDLYLEKLRVQKYNTGGHYVHHFDWAGGRVGVALREMGGKDQEVEEESIEGKGRRELRGSMERVSSFMVYVETAGETEGEELIGGGTEFPRLKNPLWPSSSSSSGKNDEERWCKWIECPSPEKDTPGSGVEEYGVTFKPIAGNAVFWENLREDGSGYDETWHSGLPVQRGVKVGLNIWGWSVYPGR